MTTNWSTVIGKPFVTVSPTGIATGGTVTNGGADYGPDTASTISFGINEAMSFVNGNGGGTVYCLPGTYNFNGASGTYNSGPVVFNGYTDVQLILDEGAVLEIEGTSASKPIWHITVGANVRYPQILFVGSSHCRLSGGKLTSTTALASQVSYLGGVHLAGNNDHIEIDHMMFASLSNFGIHASAAYSASTGLGSGVPTTSSGAYSYIDEHDNYFDTLGSGGGDGGGVRWGNDMTSSPQNCHHIRTGFGDVMTSIQMFGLDIANGGMAAGATLSDIVVGDPVINLPVSTGSPQTIALNFENAGSAADQVTKVTVFNPHVTGGYKGAIIGANWSDVVIVGGTYELAYHSGLEVGPGGGTTKRVTIVAPKCRNNNQSASTTGQTRFGLAIGSVTGGGSGTLEDVEVLGGQYFDDQATPTQSYGVGIFNGNSGATVTRIAVRGGCIQGNVDSGILLQAPPTGPVTNVYILGVDGFDPRGKVTSPFDNTSTAVGPTGGAASPTASTDYAVSGPPLMFTSSGGTGVSITVKDAAGNTIYAPGATLAVPFLAWPGCKINWGAFTAAPTVTVWCL